MNLVNCNFPLQQPRKQQFFLNQSQNSFSKEISPIGIRTEENEMSPYNCDLPQQINSLFTKQKQKQTRPLLIKTLFSEPNYTQNQKKVSVNAEGSSQTIKKRVSSIYEKVLQASNQKKKTRPIQATFKPKELKQQLEMIRSQSLRKLVSEKTSNKNKDKNQNNNTINSNRIQRSSSKKLKTNLFNDQQPKTRYEKVLQDHFKNKVNNNSTIKAKSIEKSKLTQEQVRISNIFGKNQKIIDENRKLKDRYNSLKVEREKQRERERERQNKNRMTPQKAQYTYQSKSVTKPQKPEMKRSQSQRWMSMNFQQRQKKVLQNRKTKQQKGKQEKIENEIKPCTFRPTLYNKTKGSRIIGEEKQSYLQIYYDRLHKRF